MNPYLLISRPRSQPDMSLSRLIAVVFPNIHLSISLRRGHTSQKSALSWPGYRNRMEHSFTESMGAYRLIMSLSSEWDRGISDRFSPHGDSSVHQVRDWARPLGPDGPWFRSRYGNCRTTHGGRPASTGTTVSVSGSVLVRVTHQSIQRLFIKRQSELQYFAHKRRKWDSHDSVSSSSRPRWTQRFPKPAV